MSDNRVRNIIRLFVLLMAFGLVAAFCLLTGREITPGTAALMLIFGVIGMAIAETLAWLVGRILSDGEERR